MNVKQLIESTLATELTPEVLVIDDESHQHNVPEGAQSHFKVTVVADAFEGKRLLQRHRLINSMLKELLDGPVHALALHTFTQQEWAARQGLVNPSPNCRGGTGL